MKHVKYLIIGAGPSGLALAHTLLGCGVRSRDVLVVEKESTVGGLCRSAWVDGSPLDIGGGHFLDTKHKDVLDFIFQFMPESEWVRHTRISKIRLRERLIDHPLESNLWQLDPAAQIDYLESIAQAGSVRGEEVPRQFATWIRWKFGDRIADDYLLPYNQKIWSMDPNLLGTYWMYKLPDVSFRETLESCLLRRSLGSLPAHREFLYPKEHGYGEVWERMGKALGESLLLEFEIQTADLEKLIFNGDLRAEHVFSSVPWNCWSNWATLPDLIRRDIDGLKHIGIDIDYISEASSSDAHWIYEPSLSVTHHRELIRSNFCGGARGYWTETNMAGSSKAVGWRHGNPYAYPLNTVDKPIIIQRVLAWARTKGITGFGRWGRWEHMNSDIAVKEAIELGKAVSS